MVFKHFSGLMLLLEIKKKEHTLKNLQNREVDPNETIVITLSIGTDGHSTDSVDPDQTPQNVVSDLGLHCLPYIQQYFRHTNR